MPRPRKNRLRPVGLIGLGLMGGAIAERLFGKGFTVFGWDTEPRQRAAFQKLGGQSTASAAEVFSRCDCVFLSLPSSGIVGAVLRNASTALRRGHIIADTSTGDPNDAIRFSRQLASTGVVYLDATISGNSDQVRRGEVLTMVGGPKSAFARCAEMFDTFAASSIHTGHAGSATQMKLVTNLVLGLNRAALAEGLVFARALRLDGKQALKILRASMAYSRIMDVKGEKMLRGDFKPQARLSQHLKDVCLMLAAAGKSRTQLPLSQTHRKLLQAAEAAGLGALDNSAIIRVIGSKVGRRSLVRVKCHNDGPHVLSSPPAPRIKKRSKVSVPQ